MRVLIAEDQVLLREGLSRLFTDGGHQVTGSQGDARGLVDAVGAKEVTINPSAAGPSCARSFGL